MKVLLVNPWQPESFPPPSIGYLQAAIRHCLPEVEVTARDLAPALELMEREPFDIVAASFHSFSSKWARLIKSKAGKSRLICGGHHPSSSLGWQLELEGWEVVKGEGEEALVNLIAGTPGKWRFATINDLPFPDYDGLGGEWRRDDACWPVISSRGCPFECSFCASSAFWNRRWMGRSPGNVLAELENIIRHHRVRSWMFEDDNFTLQPGRAIEICRGIKRLQAEHGPMPWQFATRAETLQDEGLVAAILAANGQTAWIGVETLSQPSLDRCRKNTSVSAQLAGIATAEEAGLQTRCQFIVGLPGDMQADIDETCRMIAGSPMTTWGANIAWVLPDTAIHAAAKERGLDDDVYMSHGAPYYTGEQSMETLLAWREQIANAKEAGR